MVRLEVVWQNGLKLHFHPVLLRLILEAFAFARRLSISGAVSDAVATLSAVLAGGTFATDALYMVMIMPCDRLIEEDPTIELCLFVDDLTLQVIDEERFVATKLQRVTSRCIELLEDELKLEVSRGSMGQLSSKAKTVAVTSSSKLAKTLKPKMKFLGIAVRKSVKLLGVDFAAGRRLLPGGGLQRVCKKPGLLRSPRERPNTTG